jgi:hypothetical protein
LKCGYPDHGETIGCQSGEGDVLAALLLGLDLEQQPVAGFFCFLTRRTFSML